MNFESGKEVVMGDVVIGEGNLAGRGVYARRDFHKGEVVIKYNLTPLTQDEFEALPQEEKMFTHIHHNKVNLYGEPERYVNDSKDPNTRVDREILADVAIRDIKSGEMITGDSVEDDF